MINIETGEEFHTTEKLDEFLASKYLDSNIMVFMTDVVYNSLSEEQKEDLNPHNGDVDYSVEQMVEMDVLTLLDPDWDIYSMTEMMALVLQYKGQSHKYNKISHKFINYTKV